MTFPYDTETQRLTAPTTRINYHQVADDLSDSEKWFHINRSITNIAQSIILITIAVVFAGILLYSFAKAVLIDILTTGISIYTLIAPAVLLVIIGYWLRGRRNEH
jgi:hypothetical protein